MSGCCSGERVEGVDEQQCFLPFGLSVLCVFFCFFCFLSFPKLVREERGKTYFGVQNSGLGVL